MHPAFLFFIYAALIVTPFIISGLGAMPPRSLSDELATGAGMVAFAMILLEFVLSGRFRTISSRIGMDITMRLHQLLARAALVLALLHPFFYQAPFNYPRPWDVTRQLTLSDNMEGLMTGLFAWVLLPVFIMFSVLRDQLGWKYETWRLFHGLGAVVIAGFALHHTLHVGRYAQSPMMTTYWIGMFCLAVFSLFFVYVIKPFSQYRKPWHIKSVHQIAERIWELEVKPYGHAGISYKAGQFVWLNVGHSPFSLFENPFSISSAPGSGKTIQFVIKEFGDFTRSLGGIKPGTIAYLDGPHGNLVAPDKGNAPDKGGIVFIAGGVGIAPLIGILRDLHLQKDTRPTILVYGNRRVEQIVYKDELDRLSKDHGTKLIHVLSEPPGDWSGETGFVDNNLVATHLGMKDRRQWTYILCGPPSMITTVEAVLKRAGIPKGQIFSEKFKYD